MEKTFNFKPLQKAVTFRVAPVAKATKNASYTYMTPCSNPECQKPIETEKGKKIYHTRKQKFVCSGCSGELTSEPTHKIVEGELIPADLFKSASMFESKDVELHSVFNEMPDVEKRKGRLYWVTPTTDNTAKDYATLKGAIGNRVMIGKTVLGNNECEVLVYVLENKIVMQEVLPEALIYDEPFIETIETNQQLTTLMSQVLGKNALSEYDFTAFVDGRKAFEEDLILRKFRGEELPEPKIVVEKQASEQDELERMKALLGE